MSEFSSFEDLSAWNQQETPVVVGGQVSPDGLSNAFLVEDNGAAVTEAIYKTQTPPGTSETVTRIFWVKQQASNNVYCGFRLRFDTGGTDHSVTYYFDPELGDFWPATGTALADRIIVVKIGDWWRIAITATNNGTGNTRELTYIFPARAVLKNGDAVLTTGVITAFIGVQTPISKYDDEFIAWDFSSGNGRRVAARPVAPTPAGQGTLFISTTGTGVGTESDPMSLMAGAAAAVAGDIVFLRGGIYLLDNEKWTPNGGTAGNPITYESYPGEISIFETDPATIPADPITAQSFLWVDNDYTILRRIESRFMVQTGVELRASNCELHGVYAHDNKNTGIINRNQTNGDAAPLPNDNLIQDCIGHDNSDVDYPANGGNADGIAVTNGNRTLIRYCAAARNSDDGIDLWGGFDTIAEFCVAHNNGIASGNGNGFKLGRTSVGNNLARYCLAFDNVARGFDNNTSEGLQLDYCSSLGNGSVGFQTGATQITSKSVATDALSIDPASTNIDNSWDRDAGMDYESSDIYNSGFMVPVAGYDDIGAMSTALFIESVDGDNKIYANQANVEINCINAGAVEGIVEYGGITQDGITWPHVATGASTITVASVDSGALTLGGYPMKVLKPVGYESLLFSNSDQVELTNSDDIVVAS